MKRKVERMKKIREKKKKMRRAAAAAAAAVMLFGMAGCGGNSGLSEEELSIYDNTKIILHGLKETDIEVSVAELKAMESVTEKAEAKRSNGDKVSVKATGPLLDTLVKAYGGDTADFSTVRFRAGDGYSVAMTSGMIEDSDVIVSYYDNGAPHEPENGPVRIVVPGQRAMYWVRMLTQIDFETEASALTPESLILLDTALPELDDENIERNGAAMQAVRTSALISEYSDIDDNTVYNVYMTASDGLNKNETKENFLNNYIRTSGENSPEFTGPELPDGMTVNGLMKINYGSTAFLSMAQLYEKDGTATGEGVPFSALLKAVGNMTSDEYRITDAEGNSAGYTLEELSDAVFILNSDGSVTFDPAVFGGVKMEGVLRIDAQY